MTEIWRQFGIRALPSFPATRPFTGDHPVAERFRAYGAAGAASIAEPWRGITSDGAVEAGLFEIRATGVSTQPILQAARRWIETLGNAQRAQGCFGVDDPLWRGWSNIHAFVMRHGVLLHECSEAQRQAAMELVRVTCSARGYALARDVMRLNDALGEITGRHDEYDEWYYWLSIFGQPSATAPWGGSSTGTI